MHRSLVGLLVACPAMALACSSFSSIDSGGGADGGADAAVSAATDASDAIDAAPSSGDLITLAAEVATGIAARGDAVFWFLEPQTMHGVSNLSDRRVIEAKAASGATVDGVGTDGVSLFWLEHGTFEDGVARVQRQLFDGSAAQTARTWKTDISVFAVGPTMFLAGDSSSTFSYSPSGDPGEKVPHAIDHPFVTSSALVYGDPTLTLSETLFSTGHEVKLAHNLPAISGIVADEGYVYAKLADGKIARFTHDSPDVDAMHSSLMLTTIATFDPNASSLLAGDGHGRIVLWSDADHTLRSFSLGGEAPSPLRTGLAGVTSLAVSARGVFWTTSAGVTWLVP